ncbi:MAG TPA: redoxin domain-containing protein [Vicinamibacterales bacterium]|nr:redoxin domain-containing protein [Vicinamibacterales bacterium]
MLSAGMMAPDFELPNQHGDLVRLSGFRGRRHVVIAFHPLAFTPVCAAQMQEYERERATLDGQHAHVLGISIDAGPAKKAWADMLGGISFDLLSDFHPHGKVAALYGVMRDDGISQRALFVVDKTGRIAWAKLYDIPERPIFQDLLDELGKLN